MAGQIGEGGVLAGADHAGEGWRSEHVGPVLGIREFRDLIR